MESASSLTQVQGAHVGFCFGDPVFHATDPSKAETRVHNKAAAVH